MSAALKPSISRWRHVRAIALLPFMNTMLIPTVLLVLFPPTRSSAWNGVTVAATTAGAVIAMAGAALVAHCIGLFIRLGSGTLAPWDPARELVGAGAYRYSRNPMKAGLFVVLAGEALATQSIALTAWFACFSIVNVIYIRLHEEPGLLKRFGAPYREYCERVPRWWPALRTFHRLEAQ